MRPQNRCLAHIQNEFIEDGWLLRLDLIVTAMMCEGMAQAYEWLLSMPGYGSCMIGRAWVAGWRIAMMDRVCETRSCQV